MRNSVLPVMTVLSVVAGAVGLQLGESAIAAIDPIYFQGPATPARDVTASRQPYAQPSAQPSALSGFAEASGWAEGYAARAAGCGNCPIVPERQPYSSAAPVYSAYDDMAEPAWQRAEIEAAAADEVRIERSVESARVQRYLHYPVSADRKAISASLDEVPLPPEPMVYEAPVGS